MSIFLLKHQCPPAGPTAELGAEFIRWLARVVGGGFHCDNHMRDYETRHPDGRVEPTFTARVAEFLDAGLSHAVESLSECEWDEYQIAMEVFPLSPANEERVPGRLWAVVGVDGVNGLFDQGVWSHLYHTRATAERQLQLIVGDLSEGESDRAILLRWLTVVPLTVWEK